MSFRTHWHPIALAADENARTLFIRVVHLNRLEGTPNNRCSDKQPCESCY